MHIWTHVNGAVHDDDDAGCSSAGDRGCRMSREVPSKVLKSRRILAAAASPD